MEEALLGGGRLLHPAAHARRATSRPVAKFLDQRGEGLHHVGFRVGGLRGRAEGGPGRRGAHRSTRPPPGLAGHHCRVLAPEGGARHAHRARPGVASAPRRRPVPRIGSVAVVEHDQRLDELLARRAEALSAGSPAADRAPPLAGQDDRPRADRLPARRRLVPGARHAGPAPGPRHGPRGQAPVHRRRGHRLRHDQRPPGLRVLPGRHRHRRVHSARCTARRSTRSWTWPPRSACP